MTKISIKETKPSSMLTKVNMTATKKSYRLYDSQYLFDCLMEFACLSDGTSINSFIRSKEKIAKSSFLRYFHKSGLADLKEKGPVDVGIAKILLSNFFERTNKNRGERTANAHARCRYLTDNEEHSLVRFCTVLGAMGYGVTRDDLHSFAESLVNEGVDPRKHVPISKHVTEGLLSRHKDLVKIVAAASLDPKRARQATVETRDAMFSKLCSYIEMLFATGDIPWRTYQEIPASAIYNMDELGNDTTKHRNKVICQKTDAATEAATDIRTFMRTSEGDGRMPWHITVCLTTRADGT